jgi:methylmalonyl-CoA epimerase
MNLAHVGVAVRDLAQATADYRALGFSVSEPEAQPEHGVTVCFVALDNTTIELLEPLGEASPIRGFLDKRGPGVHHLAIGVGDLGSCLHTLAAQGVPLIDKTPRPGAHHMDVAFAHPSATSSRVLLEFCEPAKK